jgi:pimeloyl-ACP methyl ester carboxylesterase
MAPTIAVAPTAAHPLRRGSHNFHIRGVDLRYHVRGRGSAICVALPGGPALSWDYLRMPEIERHMRVVYVELLGTGRSGRRPGEPSGHDREVQAGRLESLLDHLGEKHVHLLGHGAGAEVAQHFALTRPRRLAGLVLYASSPLAGPEQAAETRRQLDRFIRHNQWHPELQSVVDAVRSLPDLDDDRQLTLALRRAFPALVANYWSRQEELSRLRSKLTMTYVSAAAAFDDRSRLPGLAVPTLVIAGSYDIRSGVRWARELHSLVPCARLLILPCSGHFGHVEEPERFAEGVIGFVAATRPDSQQDRPLAA